MAEKKKTKKKRKLLSHKKNKFSIDKHCNSCNECDNDSNNKYDNKNSKGTGRLQF